MALFCEAGAFWVVDPIHVAIRATTFWSQPGTKYPSFELVTRVRSFSYGQGLPGSAWLQRTTVRFRNIVQESNFPRASVAAMEDLQGGVAFPALHGQEVLGVFEFFTRAEMRSDMELDGYLARLGQQVGVFLQQHSIAEHLVEEGTALRIAAEHSIDAVITIDENSTVIYANPAVAGLLGWKAKELIGTQLTKIMPEHLRPRHNHGLSRYIATGKHHVNWAAIDLPGLHKEGHIVPLSISFGEFRREGQRVFTGFLRARKDTRVLRNVGAQ
ncbi:MAG: PAS domain S-box protein [Acidobacteria bacterium]|nr:PAS domain S-box protein [Acidobacteriota bacterium]